MSRFFGLRSVDLNVKPKTTGGFETFAGWISNNRQVVWPVGIDIKKATPRKAWLMSGSLKKL